MSRRLRKITAILLGPIVGTLAICLLIFVLSTMGSSYPQSGADEVAEVVFYFLFMPLFCVIGIGLQAILFMQVYDLVLKEGGNLIRMIFILGVTTTVLSSVISAFMIGFDNKGVFYLLISYAIYYICSQGIYYFMYLKKETN